MKYVEGTSLDNAPTAISTRRLTIKDIADRVNYFDNATIETVILLGSKFYKISHDKGVEYYNPDNVVFMEF